MSSTSGTPTALSSGILDNHRRGRVGDFLREKICAGSELSFVSAYFTIYAYEALREELSRAGHLARVLKAEQIGHWLKAPNPAFDGSTPLQVIERGEMDRIWRMLYDIESGQPG